MTLGGAHEKNCCTTCALTVSKGWQNIRGQPNNDCHIVYIGQFLPVSFKGFNFL